MPPFNIAWNDPRTPSASTSHSARGFLFQVCCVFPVIVTFLDTSPNTDSLLDFLFDHTPDTLDLLPEVTWFLVIPTIRMRKRARVTDMLEGALIRTIRTGKFRNPVSGFTVHLYLDVLRSKTPLLKATLHTLATVSIPDPVTTSSKKFIVPGAP